MEDGSKCCLSLGLIVLGIGVLLTCILVPMSFSGLEYYEYGFKKQKSTGTVNTEKVYGVGRHMVGPDYEFKIFPASAQHVSLTLDIFTKDKLEIEIKIYFQYFLRKEDLPILHKFYDLVYEPTIKSSAVAALKIEAPKYSTLQYIQDRRNVEAALFTVVRERLGGKCCQQDCKSWVYACPSNCIPLSRCDADKQKGLWVDVKFFQMGRIEIPDDVADRYLKALTLKEEVAREEFLQEAAVVRKGTVALVHDIKNQAKEVRETAQAQSKLINTVSQANYTATVEKARSEGLKHLYQRLNIVDQDTKNSFDYLRTLRGLDHVHLTVDFQQRIVGGFGGS
ncbi:uncharacterized protein LOC101853991 [Aplysia californica]|uniref:Uncharacterized protein LOC101853991 n=1 Tax=Aplysia californica TaxID=6500 RepID=A0ABM0JCJ9_APLCA|nr:uncharacterized protein LOC101853991 [Aplysia californica]